MAINGSGWSAMGSTSFCSSAALFFTVAAGGGEGFAPGGEAADAPALVVCPLPVEIPTRTARVRIRQGFIMTMVLVPRHFPRRIGIVLAHFLRRLCRIR